MSRTEIAVVVLLGTMAFATILGALISLGESEKRADSVHPTDLDPTGITTTLHMLVIAVTRTVEWKKEDRPVISLFWFGVSCAIAACAVAFL